MDSNLKITLIVRGGTPRTITAGPSVLLGSGRAADVRVPDRALAPVHVRIQREGTLVTAIALAPGVLFDGKELDIDEVSAVAGRNLDIGPVRVVAELHDEVAASSPERTESLARELLRELLGVDERGPQPAAPEFIVERGPATGQRRALGRAETSLVLGRGEMATWVLLDPDLSRTHATVDRRADGVRICDLGSKNGTRVNGRSVGVGPPGVLLGDGAVITMGETQVRFVDPAAAMLADLEGRLAAVAAGVPGAVTQTRPGHIRGGAGGPEVPMPAAGGMSPAARVAVALASLVAILAVVLLVALFATS